MHLPAPYGEHIPKGARLRLWLDSAPNTWWTVVPLALTGIFGMVALAWSWQTAWAIQPGLASREWPATWGTVLESRVRDGDAVVRVNYTLDGVEYEGRRVRFGLILDDHEVVERYRAGSRVLVYYDPNSERSVLEPGPPDMGSVAGVWIIVGATGLLAGIQLVRLCRVGGFATRSQEYSPELQIGG